MLRRLGKFISFFLFFLLSLATSNTLFAQGRFLRGEEKKAYELKGPKADFYVSKKGNDAWSGKLADPNKDATDGPFATFPRVQRAVRELKARLYKGKKPPLDKRFKGSPHEFGVGNDILVLIREGVYPLDSILVFGPEDGGERVETDLPAGAFEYHKLKDYYVTYAAYPGEKPIISGGKEITGWIKKAKGIWEATPPGPIKELFVNGKRQLLARVPNSGYFETDGQPTDSSYFKFYKGHLNNWEGLENNRITMVVRWTNVVSTLVKVDEKNRFAYIKAPDGELLNVPPKYFVENVKELLDTTGEWYYDAKSNLLSLIPEKGSDPNKSTVVSPGLPSLIEVVGTSQKPVRNLRFMNLNFSATAPGGEGTLTLKYAKNCEVIGNSIGNVSQTAIRVGVGGYNNLITKNKIHDVTGGGIAVGGKPIPEHWNEVVKENKVTYNEVEMCRPARVGIATSNALNTYVGHNYVSNTGSYGITAGSWPNVEETSDGNHLVEFNHVSFTNMVRDDEGGIAVYGLSPGSVVRNNVIHDVRPAATNENVGLFFQNMSSGWTVTDNIYYNLKQADMKLCACYLVDNVYENNNRIEAPAKEAELIIDGKPEFSFERLEIVSGSEVATGKTVTFQALVKNSGSTGYQSVNLYVDGKVAEVKKFPVVSGTDRAIVFNYQFYDPGKHSVAIGTTAELEVNVSGGKVGMLFNALKTPLLEVPYGDSLTVSCQVRNVRNDQLTERIPLLVDNQVVEYKSLTLKANDSGEVVFGFVAPVGAHMMFGQGPMKSWPRGRIFCMLKIRMAVFFFPRQLPAILWL
jgi:hypothetical protein